MIEDIPEESLEAINKGRLAESLMGSAGYKLILDEFEDMSDSYLQKLKHCKSSSGEIVKGFQRRWTVAEEILKELQLRIYWYKEMKDQILQELASSDTEIQDPVLAMEVEQTEMEDDFTV